ncbi:SWIM zinc finger family protein [Amycolatopsis sp. PS_44_ISF1]|uniref:SWIM zinc finger family protein n=1 Tax=Amycolatopsis sp. PS_44_ISF1 TaxID=2974917 RepID=UPI0028DE99C5|nr:SWIM zinc finger family protein [Amycolatopsis sp. PS_44_ISF1]MDT8915320.1 SWIM zinc finger family protein [Amycolatopsis sp. PS_44_ISF1]
MATLGEQVARRWSAERVVGLAPDPASAKAGRGQAAPAKWSGTGASARAVWGACQGSGKKPYQAAVELAGPAFRCTCPSRKFPCKHALGLLLLWSSGQVPEEPVEAAWVREWLEERASRASRAARAEKTDGPKDPEAAAKRAQDRMARVTAGAAELRGWLTDRVGAGFAGFERGGAEELRGVAARMIDAQATGLAGGLRRAADLVGRGRDWPGDLLAELSLLYLLAGAAARLGELPPELAETVRTRLGFAAGTASVLESGERVADQWLVTGAADEEQDALRIRRTWLRGRHSGRPALVLSFASPGRSLDSSLPPGHLVPGELAFYPGAVPLRAVVADATEPVTSPVPRGDTVTEALAAYAEALAADPWLERWPVLLADLTPATGPDGWALSDVDGSALPLTPSTDPWRLLALAAEHPVTLAAEWTPTGLHPLTCWHPNGTVRL